MHRDGPFYYDFGSCKLTAKFCADLLVRPWLRRNRSRNYHFIQIEDPAHCIHGAIATDDGFDVLDCRNRVIRSWWI